MITIEIKKTKDFDLLGTWIFHKNNLIMGGIESQLSEIKINNEDFKKEAIQINVNKENITMKIIDDEVRVHTNGKKTIGRTFLKANDQIQVGYTTFILKKFSYSEYNFSDILVKRFKKIIRGNHPSKNIIKRLEQYLRE